MKHKNVFLSFLLLILIYFPTTAISLEEAKNLALKNNSTLKAQKVKLDAATRTKDASWNVFLPSLSLSGGLSNSHLNEAGNTSWSWSASTGLSIGLTASIPSKLKQINLTYETELTNYSEVKQSIETQVANSFYNLIAEAENIKILEDSLNLSEQQYEQAKRNYNNGLISELSLLQAQYAYLSSGPTLEKAKNAYQNSLAAFQILIGSDEILIPEGEIQLTKLSLPSTQELIDTYLDTRLDIQKKKLALENANVAKSIQSVETYAPSINLSENFSLSPNNQPNTDKTVGVSGRFSVSVSIPVNGLIPGSSNNLSLKKAEDSILTAQIDLETARKQGANDIEAKTATINQLWKSIEISNLNLSIAERAYQLSQDGYNAGLISQTELETSRQQMVSAKQNVSKDETAYLIAVYDLATAINLTTEKIYQLYGQH
ncbi:MAG: TolC family protein [Spirochaetaceae bacterium]|nr:TolC family protein [Spirochaetaceae bacterium]